MNTSQAMRSIAMLVSVNTIFFNVLIMLNKQTTKVGYFSVKNLDDILVQIH